MRADDLAVAQPHLHVLAVVRDRFDADGREHFDAVAARLLDELLGKLRASDAFGEAGIVVDPLRHAGLPAQRATVDHDRADPLAGGVDRRRQARGPTADDRHVVECPLGLQREAQLQGEFLVGGLEEGAAVAEDDRGDGAAATLQLLDVTQPLFVLVDVDPFVGDAVFAEKGLRAAAVGAPGGAVYLDLSHCLSSVPERPSGPGRKESGPGGDRPALEHRTCVG